MINLRSSFILVFALGVFATLTQLLPGVLHAPSESGTIEKTATIENVGLGPAVFQWFWSGNIDKIHANLVQDDHTAAAIKNIESLIAKSKSDLGREDAIVKEEMLSYHNGEKAYFRDSSYTEFGGIISFIVKISPLKKISAIEVLIPKTSYSAEYKEYKTKTILSLPSKDSLFVVWGGRSPRENYHARIQVAQYATDFNILKDGRSFEKTGKKLTDYHCFGTKIYAPGNGEVTKIVDRFPDQPIGSLDRQNSLGNHIVLDHGNSEWSVLAHLKKGSVTVKLGQNLSSGTEIGECGNSGNSYEPHIHYHLQNGGEFGNETMGLPAQFHNYKVKGRLVTLGEPQFGETIKSTRQ